MVGFGDFFHQNIGEMVHTTYTNLHLGMVNVVAWWPDYH